MMKLDGNHPEGVAGHRRNGVRPGPHCIPDILQDVPYRDLPLYMLVAWWVYRQEVPVSVRDVSEAFHISARRAGDLLLYLMNSVSHVQCTRIWQAIPG
ncbi:CaiF/GrlA family transcriptional regulator, partial [Salmonella enterica]|nr:CaiF/GrlA family transcriptional regulator [Salmonella enterica]